jgi:uncharacterized protein YdaT
MQSDSSKYPADTEPLGEPVRSKAQWIADRLVRAGVEEEKSMRIAVATARYWLNADQPPVTATDNTETSEE